MQKTPSGDAIPHAPMATGLDESVRQELQRLTKLSSEQATRVKALETTVSNLNDKAAASNQTIENLRASLASSSEDLELHRNLYGEARDRAVELTRDNSALEERLSILKSQLDLGLKQQKLHAQAEVDRVDRENVQLRNKLAFLLEQNRSTGDTIRHRAAQYPKLQYEHYKLAEAVLKERRKAADAQQALKQANKEVSRLERQLDICAPSDGSDSESGIDEDDLEEYPTVDELVAKGYTLPQTGDKDTSDAILTGPSASAVHTVRSDMPDPIPHEAPAMLPEPATSQLQNPVAASGAEPSTAVDNRGASLAEVAITQPPSLLQFLEKSFASTALPFELRIDVVQSQPKKTSNTATLFPYSYDHYKVWESRILITVSGQVPENDNTSPLMVSALEVYVFTIPATLSTVIYISKVDSSGYPILPSKFKSPALTNLLVTSFLTYQCAARTRPTPRVYCRLFARAQKQYLFANSSEGGAKKVLTGLGLCKWWRSVFEKVVLNVKAEQERETGDMVDAIHLNCWLPGIDPAEAKNQMGPSKVPGAAHLIWSYGPPFEDSESSPLYPNRYDTTSRKLACLIPRFEDDPKGRYLDELVINASNKSQAALRRDGVSNPTKSQSSGEITSKAIQQKRKEDETRLRREAALSLERYKPADFWETLSARQDCYPGDQTGFLGVSFGPAPSSSCHVTSEQVKNLETSLDKAIGLNLKIVSRLVTALLNHDFGTRAFAMTGTGRFLSEMERILSAEIGMEAWRQQCLVEISKNAEAVERPAATATTQAMGTPVNVLKPVRKKAKNVSQAAPSSRPNAMVTGPPGQAYHCKWRLGDQTQCLSLWATAEVRLRCDSSRSGQWNLT
jgi:regulator of Ty1 transposition protein 109